MLKQILRLYSKGTLRVILLFCGTNFADDELLALGKNLHPCHTHDDVIEQGSHRYSANQKQPQRADTGRGKVGYSHNGEGCHGKGRGIFDKEPQSVARKQVYEEQPHKNPQDIQQCISNDHGQNAVRPQNQHADNLYSAEAEGAVKVKVRLALADNHIRQKREQRHGSSGKAQYLDIVCAD